MKRNLWRLVAFAFVATCSFTGISRWKVNPLMTWIVQVDWDLRCCSDRNFEPEKLEQWTFKRYSGQQNTLRRKTGVSVISRVVVVVVVVVVVDILSSIKFASWYDVVTHLAFSSVCVNVLIACLNDSIVSHSLSTQPHLDWCLLITQFQLLFVGASFLFWKMCALVHLEDSSAT